MSNKAIYKGPTRDLQINDEDLIWVARGIYGEGGAKCSRDKAAAYLWAIMNRCLIGLYKNKKTLSYGRAWKIFSQPINPIWQRNGSMCKVGGKYHGTDYCSEKRLKRRESICNLSWDKIPETIKQAILDFQSGNLPLPLNINKRISDWASYKNVDKKFPNGQWIDDDWFIVNEGLLNKEIIIYKENNETI